MFFGSNIKIKIIFLAAPVTLPGSYAKCKTWHKKTTSQDGFSSAGAHNFFL